MPSDHGRAKREPKELTFRLTRAILRYQFSGFAFTSLLRSALADLLLSESEDGAGAVERHTDAAFRTGSDHLAPFSLTFSVDGWYRAGGKIAAEYLRPTPPRQGNMSGAPWIA